MTHDFNKVTKIYLGADRACRCGCKGEYVTRGEPKFDLRLKRFMRMWETYTPIKGDVGRYYRELLYLNISYGSNRALTVYFD